MAGAGPVLVERERELETLGSAIGGLAEGEGRVVVVEGPAGIGKTALLGRGREQAAELGVPVLFARGSELESGFPFGAAQQLFQEALRDPEAKAVALADAAAPAEAAFDASASFGDVSFSALHGLYWMTLNIAADGPLLLVVDDLQWCDRPSLRFLAYLAHRLESTTVGVLAGIRTTDPGVDPGLVADIASDPSTVVIRPGTFSLEATGEVVSSRFDSSPNHSFSMACLDVTGGNPLLLGELLGALAREGVEPTGAGAEAISEVGPRAITRTVRQRLSGLPEEAVSVARATAILGDGTDIASIAALADLEVADVAATTGQLAQAEILRAGAPIGFVHALVRDSVYEEIPLGERQLEHARAARLAFDAGAPAEKVAAQLLAAPPSGEPWAADVLTSAADEATRRGASDVAIDLLRRLLDEPIEQQRRADVLLQLGVAEAKATDRDGAVAHLRSAYEQLEAPGLRGAAAFALSRTLLFIGRAQEAADLAAEAGAGLGEDEPDLAKMIESNELTSLYFGAAVRDAAERFARYRSLPAEASGGDGVLSASASYDWMYRGGSAEECSELALAAIDLAETLEHDNGLAWVVANVVLVAAERPEAMEAWDPRALARCTSRARCSASSRCTCGAGSPSFATATCRRPRSRCAPGSSRSVLLGGATRDYEQGLLCSTLLARGRIDAAEEIPVRDARRRMVETVRQVYESFGFEALETPAVEYVETLGKFLPESDQPDAGIFAFKDADEQWIALRYDLTAPLSRYVAQHIQTLPLPFRRYQIGSVFRNEKPGPGRFREFTQFDVDTVGSSSMVADAENCAVLARALSALGSLIRLERKPTEAREPLRRALEIAEVCEAAPLAAHARTELHATGARPRSSALSGPGSLTPSERRVADLAASGQTNKQIAQALFVTPKTVEVHLSNTYRKLEIGSRRELAEALSE